MIRRDLNAPDAPAPASPYTQAVEVGGVARTLYISGQVPADCAGAVPADIESQARLAWANVAAQLRAAGMTPDNLVKVTTIVTDRAHVGPSRTARQAVLGQNRPASTLIIGGLASADWMIEVEAIACA